MAVYTRIEDEELTAFLADYDVGGLLSFKGIAEGVENTNYLVHTEKAQFILTLYEARVNEDELPFFLDLMHHLADKGISCPLPVEDRQGRVLKRMAGRPAVMISFLEGFSVNRPRPHHCLELGKALGQLHNAGLDFAGSRRNSLSLQGWSELFGKCGPGVDDIQPGLRGLIEQELAFLRNNWPADLPAGVIHADLFPDNVFFIGEQLSGLIDFYFACNDLLAYDLAICINAWCFEPDGGGYNTTLARALVSGYRQQRPLQPEEVESLPVLSRGAALRFLLTRVYDWINTPGDALVKPHNPREYLRKLRFHQKIGRVSEYGLEIERA